MRRRIVTMLMVALVASAMVSVIVASAAFAVCPVCPVSANDQAQGSFSPASTTVLAEPSNENSLHAGGELNPDVGLTKAHFENTEP